MDPPRVPPTRARRQREAAGKDKRVVKACITAGFHVLRFSHENRRIPTAIGTRGKAGGKRRGFSRTHVVVPTRIHLFIYLFIHTRSIGRPGIGWPPFHRRVADPATWRLRRLTRLLPPPNISPTLKPIPKKDK
ncbi:hypothetical protein B296_00014269 [Ensete ventricosum]|uniref:Uncharacterized protein n=1 Tax=Ensete ventricosum TaxID=4639 RepID=A0A426ZND2_ENSVE|nr:hypothetical protein B296_00014269 [Ensete ventricosum]